MTRAELIADRIDERRHAITEAVAPIDPPPQFWLDSDCCYSYCRRCVIIARGREFELGPPLHPDRPSYYWTDAEAAFYQGIDGGFDNESENAESCEICLRTLSYILTDYGVEQEANYYLNYYLTDPLATVRDEDSYAIDRLALNVFAGMGRRRLLMVAAVVGQAYRIVKGGRMTELTKDEGFLLDWLSKEDVSQLGECKGSALDRLVELGLASVPRPQDDFSGVSLTDAGYARAAELRDAAQ